MSDQDREHDATGPARKIICKQVSGPPLSEADHFFKCDEACGGWIDMRDLGTVFDHEEPLPGPVEDSPALATGARSRDF